MYNKIRNLTIPEQIRFLCDRMVGLHVNMEIGKVWNNAVEIARTQIEADAAIVELYEVQVSQDAAIIEIYESLAMEGKL